MGKGNEKDCLFIYLLAGSANAAVLDFGSLGSGDLGVSSVSLPEATITNLDGGSLYVGAANIANEICALDPVNFNCEQSLEIDFVNLVSDLSFVVAGWDPGDSVLASIFDSSDNLISSLTISSDGFYSFGSISGISKVIFLDSSNAAGVGYDAVTFNEISSVPEPSSIALLGLGLAGIGFQRKKNRLNLNYSEKGDPWLTY